MTQTALQKNDARQHQFKSLSGFLTTRKKLLAETAGKHMDSERMVRLALAAASSNPLLLQSTPESVLQCLLDCARLRLEPTGAGGVWLVPFRNKKAGTVECTAITDYRGELTLARRSGELKDISAHAVYEKEEFELIYGDEERLVHKPVLFGTKGKLQGVYAIARLANGGVQRAFMNLSQVEDRRARSRAKNNGPWVTDFEKMALKTVIREVLNLCPMALEYREWVEKEEARELVTRTPPVQVVEATFEPSAEAPEPVPAEPAQRPRSARAAEMAAAMKQGGTEPEECGGNSEDFPPQAEDAGAPEDAPVAQGQSVLEAAQEAAEEAMPEPAPPEEPSEVDASTEAPKGEGEPFGAAPEISEDKGLNEIRGKLLQLQLEIVDLFEGDHARAKALWGRFLAVDLHAVEKIAQGNAALTKARTVLKRAKLGVELEGIWADLRELDVKVPDLPEHFERDFTIKRLEATRDERRAQLERAKGEG